MKYLRLRICGEDGAALFEKDVELATFFEAHVRRYVAELVLRGHLRQGQHYAVQVVPRYAGTPSLDLGIRTGEGAPLSPSWIEMRIEDPAALDQPVRYFTLEIHVTESRLCCSVDVVPLQAGRSFVMKGVIPALWQMGVVKDGDYVRPQYLARDDLAARFDREVVPVLRQRSDELIELLPDDEPEDFPERGPSHYGAAELLGSPERKGVSIYMPRETRRRLKEEALRSHDEERGGMLVGDVFRDPTTGGWLVEVCDFTVNEATVSNITVLKHTFETWRQNRAVIRERFAGKRVVGWYHTHLVEARVSLGQGEFERTRLFFSSHDIFMHQTFFPEPWYVALVLDPDGDERFFVNGEDGIVACPGYALYDPLPPAVGAEVETGPDAAGVEAKAVAAPEPRPSDHAEGNARANPDAEAGA